MRIIRGRRDARWLPSRHNFALFRLGAYLRCRIARPDPADVILIIDRHQSAFETQSISAWVLLTLSCYLAATLFSSWPLPLALAAGVPIALAVVEVPFFVLAPFLVRLEGAQHLRAQSTGMLLCFLLAAFWFATRSSWVRYVAWQVLVLAALNIIAAVAVFLLRNRIAHLESAFGGTTSVS